MNKKRWFKERGFVWGDICIILPCIVFPVILILIIFVSQFSTPELEIKEIVSVYDGDTFRANLTCGTLVFCDNIPIRLDGVDTPEMRDKRPLMKAKAIEARDFLRGKLSSGKRIRLKGVKRGKYFRLVATVYVDGENVNELIVDKKLGSAYDGTGAKFMLRGGE
jgi:micrococcal nuclease